MFHFYYLFFSFLFWLRPFLKKEYFALGLSFDFFVFYLVAVRLESDFQKNNLSSFNLVLIWFGYRGFFLISHAISLWFCDVSKLGWLFQFTIKFFRLG